MFENKTVNYSRLKKQMDVFWENYAITLPSCVEEGNLIKENTFTLYETHQNIWPLGMKMKDFKLLEEKKVVLIWKHARQTPVLDYRNDESEAVRLGPSLGKYEIIFQNVSRPQNVLYRISRNTLFFSADNISNSAVGNKVKRASSTQRDKTSATLE